MSADLIDFGGFRIRVDLEYWPAKILRALLRRHYERNERHLLKTLVRPGDTVLELGSAIGVIALTTARITGPERVFGVDANPDMVAEARANFARNHMPATVSNRILVPGSGPGTQPPQTAVFYKTPYFLSSSLIPHRDDMVAVTVPCASLEETIEACAANVMVVDIEGGEFSLLSNARLDPLDRLSVEIHLAHGSVADCLDLVASLADQGLDLDAVNTAENVFVFSRVANPPAGFAQTYLHGLEADRCGDTDRAAAHMNEAARLSPDNASAHIQCADLAARRGDLDAALAASARALRADTDNADVVEQHAELQGRVGDDEAAARAFERAIALDPFRPLFHAGLAATYARQDRAADARDALRHAASLVPENAHAFASLVSLASRQDKFDEGTAPPASAHRDRSQRHAVLDRLADLVRTRFKLTQAAQALSVALAVAPDDEALHVALAHLTATPKDIREALGW